MFCLMQDDGSTNTAVSDRRGCYVGVINFDVYDFFFKGGFSNSA